MQYIIYLSIFVSGLGIGAMWCGLWHFSKNTQVRRECEKLMKILKDYKKEK